MADWDDWGDGDAKTTSAPTSGGGGGGGGDDWGNDAPSNKQATNSGGDDAWGDSGGDNWDSGGGSWGAGGGNTGGAKKRGCFNCGEEGHRASDCTQEKKSRGPRTCHKCGEEGHMSRECPQGGGGGGGKRACFNCGQEGHRSTDCTNPKKEGGGSGCRRCGQEGHFAKDCTKDALDENSKPKAPLYKPAELTEDTEGLYDQVEVGINFAKYNNIKVNVTGTDPPSPIEQFNQAITSETLLAAIQKAKFTNPTPVQKYAIPIVLTKRDLMACAQTGSGKTWAFLLPAIQNLFENSSDLGGDAYGADVQQPSVVIVTPTRELAIQIHQEAFKMTTGSIVKTCLIYGGTSTGYQMSQLSRGCHVLVSTPGRLVDFVNRGKISFDRVKFFVLDEADRMIDQGFLPDIRKIMTIGNMPGKGKKQMLMFSATFPDEVQRCATEFLNPDYLFLAVGMVGAANTDVDQNLRKVEKFQKRKELQELLGSTDIKDRTMIFVEQKTTADFLASFLSQNNYKATSIHGDRYQSQREEALRDFRAGRMPILVATSVASRGLDIKDVRHVINYDLPKEIDDYVHRIGRTGRVGNLGKATSFYDPVQDKNLAAALLKVLTDAQQVIPDWLNEEAAGGSFGDGADFDGFGGTDIRGSAGVTSGGGTTADDDDGWD